MPRKGAFPRTDFIVTNLSRKAKRVVKFYEKRGWAEQWILRGSRCPRVDSVVVPRVSGERGSAATVRVGVQLGELFPAPCTSEGDKALDAQHATAEVREDWDEGGEACLGCRVPALLAYSAKGGTFKHGVRAALWATRPGATAPANIPRSTTAPIRGKKT